mmetsp:Transcript_14517/g.37014  ORF Transcript_14517/g.37014 Transcript_14517/m.37014 type:complete len:551 (-) Transcript_14517:752-2404(-)
MRSLPFFCIVLVIVSVCHLSAGATPPALPLFGDQVVKREIGVEGVSTLIEESPARVRKTPVEIAQKMLQKKTTYADAMHNVVDFIPKHVATLHPNGGEVSWKGRCFASYSASVETSHDGSEWAITVKNDHSSSLLCSDLFLFATVESWHVEDYFLHGTHHITWKGHGNDSVLDVGQYGIRVFVVDESIKEVLADLFDVAKLFFPEYDGKWHPAVPDFVAEANVEFLKDEVNMTMQKRDDVVIELDESEIRSGDFFGIIRLDGLDPLLAFGMGSALGHSVVAMWINGTLYVCESQVKSSYWPANGIQRTPYKQWLQQAHAADYNVVFLPLSEEMRAKFDEQAAVDFFVNTAEGLDYGFHNLLFTWIDTVQDNYPPPLSWQLVQTGFAIFDTISPSLADLVWNDALNMRLGTKGLNTAQATIEAEKRGINFTSLLAMPEQDDWVYENGLNMVCDVFVLRTYKEAGLFGDLADSIQVTEFTDWGLYSLNFFETYTTKERPKQCQELDPDLPYCQLMGKYRIRLDDTYNSITPYAHMREKCPSLAPDYFRPADC